MNIEKLPVEILTQVFQFLDNDLEQVYKTSSKLHHVAFYDGLWKPLCDKLFRRIQWDQSISSYRQFYLQQQAVNEKTEQFIGDIVEEMDLGKLQQLLNFGKRARDSLLRIMDRQKPGMISSKKDCNIMHNYWANQVLAMIRQQEAIKMLLDMKTNIDYYDYDYIDYFTIIEAFQETCILNLSRNDIINELEKDLEQEKIRGTNEQKTVQLTRLLFDTGKTRDKHNTTNSLIKLVDYGAPANDLVNISLMACMGQKYGLNIYPILMEENGKHISTNFARVDDPTRRDGYFIINILNQMILTRNGLADMMETQRMVRLLTTKPSLEQVIIAHASQQFNKYELMTEDEAVFTSLAKLISQRIFNDTGEREITVENNNNSAITNEDVSNVLNGKISNCYLPESVKPCKISGQVLQRIRGSYAVMIGHVPKKDSYKVIDAKGLTWYLTEDEAKTKIRVMTNGRDLAMKDGNNVYTRSVGRYFNAYDESNFVFY